MKDNPSTKTSNAGNIENPETHTEAASPLELLRELLDQAQIQTRHLSEIQVGVELDACLLEKIGRIVCMTANEAHVQTQHLKAIREGFEAFLEIYRGTHPEQTLQLEKFAKLRAELQKCCPSDEKPEEICCFEPCERGGPFTHGDGYSMKSKGYINPVCVGEGPHEPWKIEQHELNENQEMPIVPQGRIVGRLVPAAPTPQILDFRSGAGSSGSQAPVTFRTFTDTGLVQLIWPPDMSGAKGGDVVLMSGNLWLKLSVDGGKTFSDLDFTGVFGKEKVYGGWNGDQVIHYVPSIDCFVLYVQSNPGSGANASKSVVKVALASPADLKKFKGGTQAWLRQWHFTSDDFGLNFWMDFPDMTFGDAFLYINTNTFNRTFPLDKNGNPILTDTFAGKLFFELPLKSLQAGTGFNYYFALLTDNISYGSPTQNIGDENYWAAHVNNSKMRIYSSKGTDANYYWRERDIKNWPQSVVKDKNGNNVIDIVSAVTDSSDWISEDHRIIGATRVGTQVWFAWTAGVGDGGGGGFKFPQAHIQIAKFDFSQDYKLLEQTQVWNADNAFAYPALTTNSDNEVGISLAWGGGKSFGSHAVGILGDFVVWFGEGSERTSAYLNPTRFGDYVHVRLAQPDTRFFSAFGYAVLNDATSPSNEKADYLYVEFGRETLALPPIK